MPILLPAIAFSLLLAPSPDDTIETIHAEAAAMRSQVTSSAAGQFLDAVGALPPVAMRRVYFDDSTGSAYTPDEAAALAPEFVDTLDVRELDEQYYYLTRYGTPVAFVRAIEVAASFDELTLDGAGILDFGYGGIGHLRAMASLGAHVTGVEIDEVARALYAADAGATPRCAAAEPGPAGTITLVHGSFPGEPAVREAVEAARPAGGFDLVVSKNVLKRGYIHPEQPVDPRAMVHLGVDDGRFVHTISDLLAPGGLFVIYNLTPKPNGPGVPYRTWADGRCPFEAGLLETAGFEILAYDRDDAPAARAMARTLGWDASMDVQTDLFARFTVLRKR